jgi:ubiquinone/menaquinone biosynthesis C-methylase UbiE
MGAHAKYPLRTLGSFGVALLFALLAAPTAALQPVPREQLFRMADIFQALGLRDGSRVADVGAGPGFFAVPMARAVGETGRVFAVDIDEKVLERLRQRIREATLNNIEVIHGDPRDPKLPADSLDAALIVDAYHEMTEHEAMLIGVRRALKPGGRLVIMERMPRTTRDKPRKDQVDKHVIAPDFVQAELSEVGFEIVDRRDDFISRPQDDEFFWLIIARRPG